MLIEHNDNEPKLPDSGYKKYIIAGLLLLLIGGGATYFWLIRAQLYSAAIAPGVVEVEGDRKTVAHLEGGIVKDVLVKEGQMVTQGQTLITLAPVSTVAQVSQLELRYFSNLARKNRLESQRYGDERVVFDKRILQAAKKYPTLYDVMKTQQTLFSSGRNMLISELRVLKSRLAGLEENRRSYTAQLKQQQHAYQYLKQELDMYSKLSQKGYGSKIQTVDLSKSLALLATDLVKLQGSLASLASSKAEIEEQIQASKNQYLGNIEDKLQDVTQTVDNTQEQLTNAQDVLQRLAIRSPATGRVVGLAVHSTGDVVSPGETLLQVVPSHEQLIIEATLKPEDIDVVRQGQKAMVRLTAYNYRTTPMFNAKVINVAADRLLNEERIENQKGFKIKVSIDNEQLKSYPEIQLHPGMPAEVYVINHRRTPMDYLLEPLEIGFLRAFRESYFQ